MKTSAIEVHDMLPVFSVNEVETQIGAVSGVESVNINLAACNATVHNRGETDVPLVILGKHFDAAGKLAYQPIYIRRSQT